MEYKKTFRYIELKNSILRQFADMPYYSPIPSERDLCESFNVSRPTVRKALEQLESEGKIIRIQGKGAFFLGGTSHVDSNTPNSLAFYNEVAALGGYTHSKVLTQNIENSSKQVAFRLGIPNGGSVFHLERLRYIDNELYSLVDAYLPLEMCPELLKIDFTGISLYGTLKQYGITPNKMHKTIEIKKAGPYESIHLGIPQGDPVSVIQNITRDGGNRIIEYAISRSSAYKTRFEMIINSDMIKPHLSNS